ncbi:hypothetical protein GQ53DRAFT_97093 [Thozetella sp. PMI_491]|nr:hypothetical protein GQ53DRAFT_97093 [Thozetella sp. PMI_491]
MDAFPSESLPRSTSHGRTVESWPARGQCCPGNKDPSIQDTAISRILDMLGPWPSRSPALRLHALLVAASPWPRADRVTDNAIRPEALGPIVKSHQQRPGHGWGFGGVQTPQICCRRRGRVPIAIAAQQTAAAYRRMRSI